MAQVASVMLIPRTVWSAAALLVSLLCWAPLRQGFDPRGSWWWCQTEIEAGHARRWHGQPVRTNTERWWMHPLTGFLTVIGRLYAPEWMQATSKLNVFSMLEPQDSEGRFCRQVLNYMWLHPQQDGMVYPQVRATNKDILDFIEACRHEYPMLGDEERQLLEQYRLSGSIPVPVVVRDLYPMDDIGQLARTEPLPSYEVPKMHAEELTALLKESVASSVWSNALPELPEPVLDYYQRLDLRVLPTISADWAEVARAIRQGRIAGFDATKLFPGELFNLSMEQLADMEGDAAERIPILSNGFLPLSLRHFAEINKDLLRCGRRPWMNLANWETITMAEVAHMAPTLREKLLSNASENCLPGSCTVGYVNSRRMKKFFSRLPSVAAAMDMQEEVLREEGYLWMGPVRGGFHYDEEANIYVQLSGNTDVFLIPQSHVDIYTFGRRHRNIPSMDDILNDPFVTKVPFHLFRLRPGEAVTFPGGTFHLFLAQTPNRIAVNFFFLPRWRRMEYTDYDWYTKEAQVTWGLERLALRQLWARSFVHLYETTGKGIVYMGEKNEYI